MAATCVLATTRTALGQETGGSRFDVAQKERAATTPTGPVGKGQKVVVQEIQAVNR